MKQSLGMATAILALTVTQSAYATPIIDNYIGSDNNGYGDVICDSSTFDIQSMDIELTGNMLSVCINANFAD